MSDPLAGVGQRYLDVCHAAESAGATDGRLVADGLLAVLSGRCERFEHTYPCHSPTVKRWFTLSAVPAGSSGLAVVMHTDVSSQVLALEHIQDSERRFRALVEDGFDGVTLLDPQGRITYVSPAGLRILGRPEEEVTGRHFSELIVPADLLRARQDFARLLEAGAPTVHARLRFARPGGGERVVEFVGRSRLDDPAICGIVCNFSDVTDRHRSEATLQQTEAKLRGLFESNVVNITFGDDEGRVFDANDAFLATVGYSREELEAGLVRWPELTPPEFLDVNRRAHEQVKRQGRSEPFEKQYLRRDGSRVWVLMALARLPSAPGHTVAISTDITERKAIEQALVESERKFSSIFSNSPLALYISELATGTIVECNPALAELTGFRRDEILGRTPSQLGVWKDDELRASVLERLTAGATLKNVETTLVTRSGARRHVLVSLHRLAGGEHLQNSVVVAVTDVTDRHLLEEQFRQAQKMEGIGRLAGGVAHDFNNLLTAIIGYSELVSANQSLPSEVLSDVGEVLKAGLSAAGLTRQLLAFSRRQTLQPAIVDLNDIVTRVLGLVRRLVGEDIEIATSLEQPLPRVLADAGQIEQVIVNLVVNARDAMPGGGTLTISTAATTLEADGVRGHGGGGSEAGRHVRLAVSDTGVGMDATVKARLFEPFFTTKEAGKGTGLGLATIYGIVKQSGGLITVSSEPRQGATFTVYLQVSEQVADATASAARPVAAIGSETVLIVEDQADVRALAREALGRSGYRVLTASTPSEAIALRGDPATRVDMLLTDVIMPQMSGRQLARTMCDAQPALRVLYMSGYTDDAIAPHGVLEPGLAFIQKPFSSSQLLARVRAVLDAPIPPGA